MKLAAFGSGNFKRALLVNNLYTYLNFQIANQRIVLLWLITVALLAWSAFSVNVVRKKALIMQSLKYYLLFIDAQS